MLMADFSQIHSHIKCNLFKLYCCSYYGAPLWCLQSNMVCRLCVAWRKVSRKIWRLSSRKHCDILPLLSDLCTAGHQFKAAVYEVYSKGFQSYFSSNK